MTENLKISPEMFKESTDHYNSLEKRIERNEADRVQLVPKMVVQLKLRYKWKWTDYYDVFWLLDELHLKYWRNQIHFSFEDEERLPFSEIFDRYIKDRAVRFRPCGVCKSGGQLSTFKDDSELNTYETMVDCPECNGSGYVPISPEGAVE